MPNKRTLLDILGTDHLVYRGWKWPLKLTPLELEKGRFATICFIQREITIYDTAALDAQVDWLFHELQHMITQGAVANADADGQGVRWEDIADTGAGWFELFRDNPCLLKLVEHYRPKKKK